jgi:hypothetical protein
VEDDVNSSAKECEATTDIEDRVIGFISEQLSVGVSPRELTEALAFHAANLSIQAIEDHFNGMHLVFSMIVQAMNRHAEMFRDADNDEDADEKKGDDIKTETLNEVELASIEKLSKTIH